ncbi:MAG: TIGR01212 family radical SAM protein [Firmicutes bacterium]|nr:TIGR01212 family radical SAM protein [Bacillota bacterium]
MEFQYKTLKRTLFERYGCRVGKICIDGGFTCPNRDGKCGVGGCIFCGERGSGEHITEGTPIRSQVERFLSFPAAERYSLYIAYFQNFTNTYAPPEVLRSRFGEALIDERIRVLDIGTRPDCVDEERADVLADFKTEKLSVWCELGLQTSNDATAALINRGYKSERFTDAVKILRERGIDVVVHMIIGLPNETERDVDATVDFINAHDVSGVKIHSLYVMRGTALEKMYAEGRYTPMAMEYYVSAASRAISRLRPDITLHRVTGDCPRGLLVAPEWTTRKSEVISRINMTVEKMQRETL